LRGESLQNFRGRFVFGILNTYPGIAAPLRGSQFRFYV